MLKGREAILVMPISMCSSSRKGPLKSRADVITSRLQRHLSASIFRSVFTDPDLLLLMQKFVLQVIVTPKIDAHGF